MDAPTLFAVQLDAHPGDVLPWLRRLAVDLAEVLPRQQVLIVGPPTLTAATLAPYETAALYVAPRTMGDAAQAALATHPVALAVTYVPLHHARVCLELRVWFSSPATLDAVHRHMNGHFAHARPVLSGVATSSAASPRGGAPQLACNYWLEAHLRSPGGHASRLELYPAWLEQYRALRGDYPADPRRSFRSALAACRRRIRQTDTGESPDD